MKASYFVWIIILVVLLSSFYLWFQDFERETFGREISYDQDVEVIDTLTPLIENNSRWGKTELTVYIDVQKSMKVNGFDSEYIDDFKEAVNTLENSIGKKIVFSFTNLRDSDILVSWVNDLSADSLDAIGDTKIEFSRTPSFSVIKSADISLLTRKHGQKLTNKQMVSLSIHELGHAIGLGHTNYTESIMYPILQEITELSDYDIRNILEAYEIEPLPDLFIKSINITKNIFSKPLIKRYLYDADVVIINNGLSDSGIFNLLIEANGNSVKKESQSLEPGEHIIWSFYNVSVDSDFSSIKVIVDPENMIEELDELNTKIVNIV